MSWYDIVSLMLFISGRELEAFVGARIPKEALPLAHTGSGAARDAPEQPAAQYQYNYQYQYTAS